MTLADMREAIALHDEIQRRQKRRKIWSYFPDEGPLRRELYPIHLQFFANGKNHRKSAAIAANRVGKCITIDSIVDTTAGPRAVRDLLGSAFEVWAWDGQQKVRAQASAPFCKPGLHECYRITFANGEWLEAADHHRFLCGDGWRLLSELLPLFALDPQVSTAGFARSVHGEGGLRSSQTPSGSQDRYSSCCRQCGELLPSATGSGQASTPSPAGARQHSGSLCGKDAPESESCGIPSACEPHPSIQDGHCPREDRCAVCGCRDAYRCAPLLSYPSQELQLPVRESGAQSQPSCVPDQLSPLQFPSYPILLDAANKIVSVCAIGYHEVYDFSVEVWHNYIAANMVSHNTETMGCYELACHLTGIYPDWWPGRKFDRAIYAWAAGDTAKTVRDIIQQKLLGPWDDQGTGLLLGDSLLNVSPKSGVPQAAEIITVKHVSGGVSRCVLKSYDQRREAFQGTEVDVILADEEPPLDVWIEMLIRTMTNNGLLLATFTPLMGRTELVKALLDEADDATSGTAVVSVTWDDVPHLTQEAKDELWKALPPFQRDARSKGIPQLGAGAIYQVSEEDLLVDPFKIPDHWPRAYGMDVGWNRTAAVWGALDRDTGTLYLYHEHYMGQSPPSENARGIRAPGEWIPGVIDPAANGRSQRDGEQLIQDYRDLGLNITQADNSVEAGIYRVWGRMISGRLKVFRTLGNWIKEYRVYQRDENGRVVKKNDHIMDATRYLEVSGVELAAVKPVNEPEDEFVGRFSGSWMG